jgi:uncharacterized protein YciI
MYFLLFYDYVENAVERRAPFREAHLKLAREANARGELILAGAFAEPVDGAALGVGVRARQPHCVLTFPTPRLL